MLRNHRPVDARTGGTWTESILYNFEGGPTDGAGPDSLILASDGNFTVQLRKVRTQLASSAVGRFSN